MNRRRAEDRAAPRPERGERWSDAEGAAMLAALAASGESDGAFARRTGVAPHRIYYWRKKLDGPVRRRTERTVSGFVPVRVVDEPGLRAVATSSAREVEATLPSGARLVFRGAWDRASLRPWIAALGASDAE